MQLLIESLTPILTDYVEEFIDFMCDTIGVEERPVVTYVPRTGQASFGSYQPSTGAIIVAVEGRHIADTLRTLGHEIVHHKQMEAGEIGTLPLLDLERDANAVCGLAIRDFNKMHPELYGVEDALPDDQLDQEGESLGAVDSDTTRPSGPINMAEDMTAGAGDVAGIGVGDQGEPGVPQKKKKTLKMFRRKLEEYHDKVRTVNDTDAKKRLAQARTIFGQAQKK